MRFMDQNNRQMLDDPVIFERALCIIEDEETRWVVLSNGTVTTPDKHKVSLLSQTPTEVTPGHGKGALRTSKLYGSTHS
jgi:hypothetical protein